MSRGFEPEQPVPEPRGALVPPVRHPPTAVGIATPPPPPRRPRSRQWVGGGRPAPTLRGLLNAVLDAADVVADSIGDAVRSALAVGRGR